MFPRTSTFKEGDEELVWAQLRNVKAATADVKCSMRSLAVAREDEGAAGRKLLAALDDPLTPSEVLDAKMAAASGASRTLAVTYDEVAVELQALVRAATKALADVSNAALERHSGNARGHLQAFYYDVHRASRVYSEHVNMEK